MTFEEFTTIAAYVLAIAIFTAYAFCWAVLDIE